MNDLNDPKIKLNKNGWKEYGKKSTANKKTMRGTCNHCSTEDKHEFITENDTSISFRCCKCEIVNIMLKYM